MGPLESVHTGFRSEKYKLSLLGGSFAGCGPLFDPNPALSNTNWIKRRSWGYVAQWLKSLVGSSYSEKLFVGVAVLALNQEEN